MKNVLARNVLLPFLSPLSSNSTLVIVMDDVSFVAVAVVVAGVLSVTVLLSVRVFIDCALSSVLMSRKVVYCLSNCGCLLMLA